MPDEAEVHVERVELLIDAPKTGLDGPDSGLNVALRKLGAVDRLLRQVEGNYTRMLATMNRNPFPGRQSGMPFLGQQRLFEQQPKPSTSQSPPAPAAHIGGRVELPIAADQVVAFVTGGRIPLAIHASQIDATVTGGNVRAATGAAGGAGTAAASAAAAGKTTGTAAGQISKSEQAAADMLAKFKKDFPDAIISSEKRVSGKLVEARYQLDKEGKLRRSVKFKESAGGSLETVTSEDLRHTADPSQRRQFRTSQEQAQRDREANDLRESRRQRKADEMAEGRERARQAEQERQLRQGQFGEAQKRTAADAQARKDKSDAQALKTDPALRRFRRTDQEQMERNRAAEEIRAKRDRSLSMYGTRRFGLVESGRVAPGMQMGSLGQQSKDFERYIENARKAHSKFEKELDRFNKTNSHIGKNMVQNVQHVTAWAASVGVLYGGLNLVNYSLSQYIELQYQTARLQQVLRAGYEDSATAARRLAEEVLFLAANTGRSSKEAMEAAISWARVLSSRREVSTATGGSLLLANVGEISAAKSTEHLSSLMAVYKFRVSDIAGVIGMANDMSNRWRITNEQMFNGLTRTASIAKQAGIPLAELMGIIGAGVGETGQSGPNMGNALKSLIGSLTNPDVQKFLREGFGVETTQSGQGLKEMPELLAEIFVAYQKMTQAEKQSMVFGAVGKNQASRVAAMLDSYVKSQVLAISAQLNLNSAEKENEKIRSTMKSQLQGLSAEWDKFVVSVGNKGPAQALTDTARALRALLAIFDGPKMSAISAGFLGLGTAIGAKLLLTSFQAGKSGAKGGVLANTAKALGTIPSDLALLGNQALLRGSIFGGAGAVKGNEASATWTKTATGLRGIIVPARSAEEALAGMGRGAKLARLGMLALVDVAVPLLVLWGAFKLIAAGAEAFGFTSDAASESVDKLEKSALAARSAVEATTMQLRLLNTTQRALENTSSQSARLGIVKNIPDALLPDEGNDNDAKLSANKARRDAMLKELEAIERIGDAEERNAARAKFNSAQSVEVMNRRTQKRREENRDALAQIDEWQREMRRLEKSPFNQKDRIKDIQGKVESLRGSQITKLIDDVQDQDTSRDEFERNSDTHQAFLARLKGTVESIRDVWNSLPGDSHLDKLNKELAANQSILEIAKEQKRVAMDRLKSKGFNEESVDGINGYTSEQAKLEQAKLDVRKKFSEKFNIHEFRGVWDASMSQMKEMFGAGQDAYAPLDEDSLRKFAANKTIVPNVKGVTATKTMGTEFRDEARKAVAEIDALTAAQNKLTETEQSHNRMTGSQGSREDYSRYQAANKESIEAQKRIKELEAQRQARVHQDRIELASRFGTSEGESFGVGDDRAEQLQNTIAGLRKSISEKEQFAKENRFAIPGKGMSIAERDRQTEVALVEAMVQRKMLSEAMFKGQELLNDAHREELNLMREKTREYQRSLLTAGPGELLRKLAVNQLSSKGLNAGQFFSLDVNSRQDFLSRPENDEGVKRLRREQQRLRDLGYKLPGEEGFDDKGMFDEQQQGAADRSRLGAGLVGLLPDKLFEVNDAAREAANGLGIAGRAGMDLAGKLDALGQRVDKLFQGGQPQATVPQPRAQNNPNN